MLKAITRLSLVDRIAVSTSAAASIAIVCVFAYAAEPAGRLALTADASMPGPISAHVSETDACPFSTRPDAPGGEPAGPIRTI